MDLYHIETELESIIKMICQPQLADEIVRVYDFSEEQRHGTTQGACVHILGGWNGSVSIECADRISRSISKRMLYIEDDDSECDWQCVMKELANVIGGNIKGLLGENCILSTPKAVEGEGFNFSIPETTEILSMIFCCSDEYMLVKLHEGDLDLSLVE